MDIYIMGNKIDYTIEHERTVKDVIDSISEIVNGYGHSITELRVDGKEFSADDPALEKIELNEVNNLEIETASFFEISSSLILSLIPYVESFKTHIEENTIDFGIFDQAKSWISDVLVTSVNLLFIFAKNSEIIHKRDSIVKFLLDFSYDELSEDHRRKQLLEKLGELHCLLKEIMEVLNKISEKGNLFFDTTIDNDISELLRLLDDIPLKLQLGKDREALSELYSFSETFISLIDFIDFSISSSAFVPYDVVKNFDLSKFDQVNSVIESVMKSISSKDLITASDLMSYELRPLVEELQQFVLSLRESLFYQIAGN
ncbi:MAG: hypothetical protein ABDH28_01975 [Brevinematia bacterium]